MADYSKLTTEQLQTRITRLAADLWQLNLSAAEAAEELEALRAEDRRRLHRPLSTPTAAPDRGA